MPNLKEIKKPYDFVIIDGRNVGYIYSYAMARLHNSLGECTGMYHGFLSLLLRLKLKFNQARFVVAWEGGELIRKAQILGYKGQRIEKNEGVEKQYVVLKELLCMMGVTQLYSDGHEADDVAATFVKQNVGKKQRVLLVTEDKDWNQILRKGISFWRKNKEVSYEDVAEAEQFPPERYALYVLLKGKASNSVHGVKGFPDKLARSLVSEYTGIQSLLKSNRLFVSTSKWLIELKERKDLLLAKYKAIKLCDSVELKEVSLCPVNRSQLKKRLNRLQLSKVMNLLSQVRRMKKK